MSFIFMIDHPPYPRNRQPVLWRRLRKSLFLLFVGLPLLSQGQKTYDFNTRCRKAYHQIMMLKIDEGQRILNEEKRTNPDNLIPYFLENYADQFRLFFGEDKTEYKALSPNREKRIALMQQGPKDSPFYLFTQAMIYAQWGLAKLKNNERLSAMWDMRRAYLLIRENRKNFPGFSPNNIVLGPMQALIGTIPSGYRWITNILGFTNGSVLEGMKLLRTYVEDTGTLGTLFKDEACFYYVYLQFYILHEPDQAMQFIKDRKLDVVNNELYAFMAANLALNNHQTAYGLQILENRNKGPEYLKIPALDYEMGDLKLNHLELDESIYYLKKFLDSFKGTYYVKDALLKLSWAWYLKGNMAEAEKYRKMIQNRGSEIVDADKAAMREARSGRWPDATILKARMLMNGGYFDSALHTIQQKKVEDYGQLIDKIEYAYFLARIYDELGRDQKALALYDATISAGQNRPEYYAARAALQAAFIYEKRKDTAKALEYFRKCLNMNEEEYKSTLDQRAKAGINRLTIR